jgi:hypothetical protein
MPFRRRRLLIVAVVGATVALAVGAWLLWPRTAITRENAAKIREGMTLAEVEAILGGPARDDYTGPLLPDGPAELACVALPRWASDRVVIWVSFDADGRVEWSEKVHTRRIEESPLDRVRRWLGL